MINKLEFSKLEKENIFCSDFNDFNENNIIEFSNQGIAVLYGPNGIGKTSLTKILNQEQNTKFAAKLNNDVIEDEDDFFHIITDQNHRNIIAGETSDFLLGEDIAREFELKTLIENESKEIFEKNLNQKLKNDYNISKKTSNLLNEITNPDMKNFIEDIVNSRSKGKKIIIDKFIQFVNHLTLETIDEFDEAKMIFLKDDFEKTKSIISSILEIDSLQISKNEGIIKIEEHSEAIKVLTKFDYVKECIICDNTINTNELFDLKTTQKEDIFESLDDFTKEILEKIINLIDGNDPFDIKDIFLEAIKNNNKTLVTDLKAKIDEYFDIYNKQINNLFVDCLNDTDLETNIDEYNELLINQPEFSFEDVRFIEMIINENIEKDIKLERDNDNKLKLLLGNTELLNQERDNLSLSTGEQNFISLAFELLKAKKSDKKIIVLDDPISSFDSIYKNKIVYCIIKFLESKTQIILTHSTDLIKLMENQYKNCFNLYLFNNIENEENGFIRINLKEKEILLYLHKLLKLFRTNIMNEIEDEKMFLISMIPFMRGYAQILNDDTTNEELTKLMHGYNDNATNITEIYNNLFYQTIQNEYIISAKEISELDLSSINILKSDTEYSLLSKTLKHTLIYFYLRLNVEKKLINRYSSIDISKNRMLGQIITEAYNISGNMDNRIFLTSRKTLLNEFNHFEGNMNIFQPAIDISDSTLIKEKNDILDFLDQL